MNLSLSITENEGVASALEPAEEFEPRLDAVEPFAAFVDGAQTIDKPRESLAVRLFEKLAKKRV